MSVSYKQLDRAIVRAMSTGDEYTVADMRELFDKSNQQIRGSMMRLCSKGILESTKYEGADVATYRLCNDFQGVRV